MTDYSHLDALQLRLSHERTYLAQATEGERQLRTVWVAQIEKEIAAERAFLGLSPAPETLDEILSDAELLAALEAESNP